MKFLYSFLPNFAISANIALMIVIYLDMRNPMMGFLVGTPFLVLAGCACVSSVISGGLLYWTCRKKKETADDIEKISE